jgi:ABC-2 type transport system ATP-binding protein
MIDGKKHDNNTYIEFRNISKKYRDIKALDDVSFSIQKGEIFGYIGPNGAGKTTTIKILVGLITEYNGKVLIDGKDISKNQSSIHKIIGYLPQEAGFQEWRTVDHALKTFGGLSGLNSENLENRIKIVLEQVGLLDVRHKKITHLSGGMIQKLRFAQAILHEPELLILDEPLSGLDPTSRYQMKNIIMSLTKKGITIFFSSHILNDVQDIADRIGILNLGKIMNVGTPDMLQQEFQVGNILAIEVAKGSSTCKGLENMTCVEKIEQINENKQILHLKSETDLDKCISEILNKITSQNCRVRNFNMLKPSLEEVYLKYVRGDVA